MQDEPTVSNSNLLVPQRPHSHHSIIPWHASSKALTNLFTISIVGTYRHTITVLDLSSLRSDSPRTEQQASRKNHSDVAQIVSCNSGKQFIVRFDECVYGKKSRKKVAASSTITIQQTLNTFYLLLSKDDSHKNHNILFTKNISPSVSRINQPNP